MEKSTPIGFYFADPLRKTHSGSDVSIPPHDTDLQSVLVKICVFPLETAEHFIGVFDAYFGA